MTQSTRARRGWLMLMATGLGLVILAMVVVALVLFDKPQFGWLVGSAFLPIITSGVIVGSLMVLIGTLALPERKSWRGAVLIIWSLIAVTSPGFGFLFLLPWCVLALLLPVVIVIVRGLFR